MPHFKKLVLQIFCPSACSLKGVLLAGVCLFLIKPAFSQQYTLQDQAEIKHSALLTLIGYEGLLNLVSYSAYPENTIKGAIQNSYNNQTFYAENSIVEDDLEPEKLNAGGTLKKNVKDYLHQFHENYAKSDTETIQFYDFMFSNLKSKDYLYIKVKFTSFFNGTHKITTAPYKAVDRLAELRVEKRDNQWITFITSITNFDPEKPVESTEMDVPIDTALADDGTISLKIYELSTGSMESSKVNKSNHDNLSDSEKYIEAIAKAKRAENRREYGKAKELYLKALQVKTEDVAVKNKIGELEVALYQRSKLLGLYLSQEYEKAIKEYDRLLRSDLRNPEIFYWKGKCFEKLNNHQQALSSFSEAIDLDRYFMDALKSRADLYFLNGQPTEALKDYNILISTTERGGFYYAERANIKGSLGDTEGALSDYNSAIQLNPEVAEYHYGKGLVQLQQKKQEQAILSFNRAIEIDNSRADSYYSRGMAYLNQENFLSAYNDFEEAQSLGLEKGKLAQINELSIGFLSIGEGAVKKGDYINALKNFDKAVQLSPALEKAWLSKGNAHALLKEYPKAVSAYTKATELDSVSFAFYKRGLVYQNSGDEVSAKNDFRRFVSVGKIMLDKIEVKDVEGKAEAWNALGYAQLMSDQHKSALVSFNEATKIKANYSEAIFNRGAAQYALGNYGKAIEDILKSIEERGGNKNENDPAVFMLLGRAYEAIGENDYADGVYSFIIDSIDKKYEPVYRQRALFYKKLGYYESALQDIGYAQALSQTALPDKDLIVQKGLIELYVNKIQDADYSFNQVLDLQKDHAMALYGKACVLTAQKRTEESMEFYRKAFQTKQIEWSVIKDDPFIKQMSRQKAFKNLVAEYF